MPLSTTPTPLSDVGARPSTKSSFRLCAERPLCALGVAFAEFHGNAVVGDGLADHDGPILALLRRNFEALFGSLPRLRTALETGPSSNWVRGCSRRWATRQSWRTLIPNQRFRICQS